MKVGIEQNIAERISIVDQGFTWDYEEIRDNPNFPEEGIILFEYPDSSLASSIAISKHTLDSIVQAFESEEIKQ